MNLNVWNGFDFYAFRKFVGFMIFPFLGDFLMGMTGQK